MRGSKLVTLLLALMLLVAACGNSDDDDDSATPTTGAGGSTTPTTESDLTKNVPIDEVGVTDTEIHVNVITAKTNPIGGKYAELADGINAYFAMVNDGGGIYGRQLKITKERDDQLANNQQETQAALAEDQAFATFEATVLFTGADLLDEADQPTFIWNINPEMAGHDNIFANSGAICFGCDGHLLPYMAEQLGATKVGILAYGVSEESKRCAAGNRSSIEKYGAPLGQSVAFFDDSIGFGQELSAQVAQMKSNGVQFITTCMDANETLVLAKELDKQGLDAVQQLPNGYDHQLMSDNAAAFEGAIVIPQFLALETAEPLQIQKDFEKWTKEIGVTPVETTIYGWILAHEFVTGLKAAGPEFNKAKLIAALNAMTEYDADGMIPPIDWTKGHIDPSTNPEARGPRECANFTVVQGGEFVPEWVEDPAKPWTCFQETDPDISKPVPTSFAE